MLSNYPNLLIESIPTSNCAVNAAEQKKPYTIFTERHMQAMWLEQKYFKNLRTEKNEPIEVISSGIWNSEAGPDFLKAHLRIGDKFLRGDIELHLSREGWEYHGHHNDPNYNHVILHVCFWPSSNSKIALNSNGDPIECTFLQPSITIPETRILKLIDLDLYPYKQFSGTGSCSHLLFKQINEEKTKSLLRSAALWRLKDKWERLRIKVESPEYLAIGGIAMALGYKHNAEEFLSIFLHLKNQHFKNEESIFIHGLALCHFFDDHFLKKWGHSTYYQRLHNQFSGYPKSSLTKPISLKLDKIRPVNHPVRRLAIMAKIMMDPRIVNLESDLILLWDSQWHVYDKLGWKKFIVALLELLPNYEDPFWNYHYTFEESNSQKKLSLIGKDLKNEILLNVFLPILYKNLEKSANELEKRAFFELYAIFPAAKTKKSNYLNYRFFGNSKKIKISNADIQQGAYQIHKDFCIHFEASCHGCPFVERYQKLHLNQTMEQK